MQAGIRQSINLIVRWWRNDVTPALRVFDLGVGASLPPSIEETVGEPEGPASFSVRHIVPETGHARGDHEPRFIQFNPIAGKLIRYSRGDWRAARSAGPASSTFSPRRASSGFAHLFRGLALLIIVGGAFVATGPAHAASVTWTGLGGTNNWSEGANWSTGVAPGSADVAIFDATSIKDATINVAASVSGIQISPGYTGTITQALVTTTVGASGFTQADGSFLGSNAAITVNGGFTLTGGSFTSTAANLAVSAGFTHTGGTFAPNGGTVTFTGSAATIDVPGTETFDNLTFAPTTGGAIKTINGGTTLIVQGNLTLTEGAIAGTGVVAARGPISQASTFDGGAGFLIIDGSGPQTLTGSSTTAVGALPNLTITKPAGTLTLAGTIRTGRNWTLASGLLDPTTSTVVFAGTLTITGSQPFNLVEVKGAVTVPAGTDLTVAADLTMPTAAAFTVNGSVTVAGNLTLTDGSIAGAGSVTVRGNVVQASTFDGGAGFLIIDGSGPQTLTGNATTGAGFLPNLTIAKPVATTLTLAGTIRTNRSWTYTSGLLDPTTSTVVFAGTQLVSVAGSPFFDVTVGGGAVPNGVTLVQGPLVVNGTLTLLSGTITTGPSKVVISPTGTVVRSSGHLVGNLEKFVPTGSAIVVTFEIGGVTGYTPAVISFGTVTTSGDLVASTTSGDHPDIANSGVAATNGVNRWWTITSSAIDFDYYDVVLDFVVTDVDPLAVFSEFIVAENDGSSWTQPSVVARSATSIEAGGLSSFGDFVVGPPEADVGVLVVGSPEPVLVAGTLTYTVTVHNFGPSPASNVVLVDPLPVGVAFSSVATSQGSCSQAGGIVTCLLAGLAADADATVSIRVVVATTPGTVVNTVTVTATETDPQTANNTATTINTKNSPTTPLDESESEQVPAPGDDDKSSKPSDGPDSPRLFETPTETTDGIVPTDLLGSAPVGWIVMALSLAVVMLSFAMGPRRMRQLGPFAHGVQRFYRPRHHDLDVMDGDKRKDV